MPEGIDLARLKELAENAGQGQWKADIQDMCLVQLEEIPGGEINKTVLAIKTKTQAAAAYIAAASPHVVLGLINKIEQLEKSVSHKTEFMNEQTARVREWETMYARLEKEADWLAEYSALDECPLKTLGWMDNPEEGKEWCDWHPDPDGNYDCSGGNVECWRRMAREAVEEMQDGN